MQTALWILGFLAIIPILYALHRAALWLEARGLLFYLHKKSHSSPASALAGLERILEPQTRYVIQVKEEKKVNREIDGQ